MKKFNSLLFSLLLTATANTYVNAQSANTQTANDNAYSEDVIVTAQKGNSADTAPYLIADHSTFNTFIGHYPVSTAPKLFNVWGDNLTGNIKLKAPANFEISKSKNSGYTTTINFTPVNGIVASKKIYVRYNPDVVGTVAVGNIVISSAGADTFLLNIAGVSKAAYIHTVPTPFAGFSTVVGTPSTEQYYNINAVGNCI